MDQLFQGWKGVLVYIDNMHTYIHAETKEEHDMILEKALARSKLLTLNNEMHVVNLRNCI
jgi:hypothetical protein